MSDEVSEALDGAVPPDPGIVDKNSVLADLAKLDAFDFGQAVKAKAKELDMSVGDLRKAVNEYRANNGYDNKDSSGFVEELEPWPAPVSGADLADNVQQSIRAHMVINEHACNAVTLWLMAAYVFDCFRIFPRLNIQSPEKRCGKSTLMELMEGFAPKSMLASNISPAAVFRTIELHRPCMMIDEADSFLAANEELRGIINSGHGSRTAFVVRSDGDDNEPKKFSTWAPMVIAGIKSPPDTIVDRSVIVSLSRKALGESVERLDGDHFERSTGTRRKLWRWADDATAGIKSAHVRVPEIENSRAMDNWLPLFTVADAVGGRWPHKCQTAFTIMTSFDAEEGEDAGALLLADIKHMFSWKKQDRMHSQDIVEALILLEDRPWSEWSHGKPITTNKLAKLLRPYKIRSGDVRSNDVHKKGYKIEDFADAFSRYLAPEKENSAKTASQSVQARQPTDDGASNQFQSATIGDDVAFKKWPQPTDAGSCRVVAVQNTPEGTFFENEDDF